MKWQLLHHACWAGDDAGADPNRLAPTNWRQRPLGRTLIARGADPALRSTQYDMTPFELACFCGLEPAAPMLEKYQADAGPHPAGMPAIWLAAASRLPISKRPTPSLRPAPIPNLGISLLHAHWHFEHLVPALKYLARNGWNVNATDAQGHTALHRAQAAGYPAVARVLLQLS